MLIECYHPAVASREAPIVVPIGNDKYTFEADAKGRKVATVWNEKHIESFLAVGHLYRALPDEEQQGQTAGRDLPNNLQDLGRSAIMARLKAKGVPFKVTETTDVLRGKLAHAGEN